MRSAQARRIWLRAQTLDKTVFEYWTHALSYVPTRDGFGVVKAGDLRKVLGRIRRHGPLTIRDIDDDVLVEKDHEWASRKPEEALHRFERFQLG